MIKNNLHHPKSKNFRKDRDRTQRREEKKKKEKREEKILVTVRRGCIAWGRICFRQAIGRLDRRYCSRHDPLIGHRIKEGEVFSGGDPVQDLRGRAKGNTNTHQVLGGELSQSLPVNLLLSEDTLLLVQLQVLDQLLNRQLFKCSPGL